MEQEYQSEDGDLCLDDYHLALIDEGIRQADAGECMDHSEVVKMAADWSRKARTRFMQQIDR